MTVTKDDEMITLSKKDLMLLLKESWWNGQGESSYSPNLQGCCKRDCESTYRAQFTNNKE